MRRTAAALVLALHGLIHLMGFVVPWGIATIDGFPARAASGDMARLLGVAWLVVAVGFVLAGVGLARGRGWGGPAAGLLALASIALCATLLPETGAGIVLDVVILGVLAGAGRRLPNLRLAGGRA